VLLVLAALIVLAVVELTLVHTGGTHGTTTLFP
jgi:hypothetical protein